jgi:hypothetical protein
MIAIPVTAALFCACENVLWNDIVVPSMNGEFWCNIRYV